MPATSENHQNGLEGIQSPSQTTVTTNTTSSQRCLWSYGKNLQGWESFGVPKHPAQCCTAVIPGPCELSRVVPISVGMGHFWWSSDIGAAAFAGTAGSTAVNPVQSYCASYIPQAISEREAEQKFFLHLLPIRRKIQWGSVATDCSETVL